MVGVISTTTVLIGDRDDVGGLTWMSGRLTTASEPRERGCSGSEMVAIRSVRDEGISRSERRSGAGPAGLPGARTVYLLLVDFLYRVVVVGIGRRAVGQVGVRRDELVEEAGTPILAALDRSFPPSGRKIRGVEDGRIGVVLIRVHQHAYASVRWRNPFALLVAAREVQTVTQAMAESTDPAILEKA